MKIGVDAPWYDDPVERTAFNLYAMNIEELNAIARDIVHNFGYDIDGIEVEDIVYSYNLNTEDAEYVYDRMHQLIDQEV